MDAIWPFLVSYLTRNLRQDATYWGKGAPDGFGGVAWAAPAAIKARWEDRQVQFTAANGEATVSRSVVYVDRDVELGGYLYLGTTSGADPTVITGAWVIQQFSKIPNLAATAFERKAFL